jgi:CubicO group peptidase (beta-lactamase class C family)
MNAHSPHAAEQAGLSAPQLERIGDAIQSRYIDNGRLVGAQALVARRGHVAYQVSLGQMDRERGRPMAEDAIFRIYSMTKPVTSLAMMMLLERGLFQLNDPITSVLPEFSGQRVWTAGEGEDMQTEALVRPVTFRDLLRHTAGLTYGGGLQRLGIPGDLHPVERAYQAAKVSQPDKDLDSFIGRIGKTPLRYQPGEAWMYSLATDVCGAVVQRLSGKRLDIFFQEDIFGPLGMVDTGFHVPAAKADRLTACYQYQKAQPPKLQDDPANSPFLKPPVFLSGGGGLVSTLKDYYRFCEMLRGGGTLDGVRLIGPRTLGLMHANHLPGGKTLSDLALDGFSESGNAGVGFGLGFAMTVDQMATANLGEDDYYWGGVASTIFWVDPWEDLVVIFLTQLIPSSTYPLRAQLKNVAYSAILD